MSFWDGEKCEHCGHAIVSRRVTLHRVVKRKHVLFENVLAGVCPHCGARFFSANVLKRMLITLCLSLSASSSLSLSLSHSLFYTHTYTHTQVVTADDTGKINLFSYPCIAKDAPHRSYSGHSSHVMNVKFLESDSSSGARSGPSSSLIDRVFTVGGKDCSAMCYRIVR